MSTEFERIARIRAILDRKAPHALVTNGDDAAVFKLDRPTVVSVDTCIEDTHFKQGWLSWSDVGWRSQVSALSDLTAMGAESRFVVVALAAPKHFSDANLDALCIGIGQVLDKAGAVLIGGNVSATSKVAITTTAIGEVENQPLLRSGAKPGDGLYVTGTLGGSGAGLRALLERDEEDASHDSDLQEDAADAVRRWRRPPLRSHLAASVAQCASACIDISDGLGQDLEHMAKASNVGFRVDASALPLHPTVSANEEGYLQAWASGEEYELLFTSASPPAFEAERIGEACERPEVQLIAHGRAIATQDSPGFDHYR